MSGQRSDFVRQINAMLQALGSDADADLVKTAFGARLRARGQPSDNVEGPIEPDEPVSVDARQSFADYKTDRMTQYDPYAQQRMQQAAQIVAALSGQGQYPQAPGVTDMRKRAGMEGLLEHMQTWNPQTDIDKGAPLPYDFRQRMFGWYR